MVLQESHSTGVHNRSPEAPHRDCRLLPCGLRGNLRGRYRLHARREAVVHTIVTFFACGHLTFPPDILLCYCVYCVLFGSMRNKYCCIYLLSVLQCLTPNPSPGRLCEKYHFHAVLVISSTARNLTVALEALQKGIQLTLNFVSPYGRNDGGFVSWFSHSLPGRGVGVRLLADRTAFLFRIHVCTA